MLIKRAGNDAFADAADDALCFHTVFEDHQGRDAPDAIACGSSGIVVNIDFIDFCLAFVSIGYGVHRRGQRTAGRAPFGPEIN